MIPRVIHYCWLSHDPMPAKLRDCLDSWRRVMPDYEIRLWDFERFPKERSEWVSDAFDNRKYAFAADYIRAYALYHEGGIYLDSDVEALRPFDDLLDKPYFLCRECGSGCVEAAVMGAEAGHPLFAELLRYYDNRSFVREDGSFDTLPMPRVIAGAVARAGFREVDVPDANSYSGAADALSILPYDYFSPISIENMEMRRTRRTYCIHHFAGSWRSPWKRFKKRVQVLIGPRASRWIIIAKRRVLGGGGGV